jgi:hypothetical protein
MESKESNMSCLAKLALLSSALAICASQAQASSVLFSSADATFYQTINGTYSPSQMIDGNTGNGGWAIYSGSTDSQSALLTLASPLAAGEYQLTFTIIQNFDAYPGEFHSLGDFSLGYTTAASPILTSPMTLVSIQSASATSGATFSSPLPGELLVGGPGSTNDTYSIVASINSASLITGIFLNAIDNPANGLPTGGPGRMYAGNFVVTEFALDAQATPLPAALPLFATGLGALGLLGWRRKRKQAAAA